ncbi:HD domain-containing protein [Kineococcus sp. NPDC059986]|uniref:HD domain-containing protein n=1 Tax=Kineococcus sp. NPDC059986 TaxID=3155538 RepID=UPI00344FFCAB
MTDTLAVDGTYRDPLWGVTVVLTPVERELLRCWWVRRLQFVVHAGAAAAVTTQSYSRLEHSLGVLALTAHVAPDDHAARAWALLHDIGHLPLSHTAEGLSGLDHHELGRRRRAELRPVLGRHGTVPVERRRPGLMTLDHLDSYARSARVRGRAVDPAELLAGCSWIDGAVTCDAATADVLSGLVVDEAWSQSSPANVVATGLVRNWAAAVVDGPGVPGMTDDEFWALLLSHPATREPVAEFRRDPGAWTVVDAPAPGAVLHRTTRLYLDPPEVDGRPWPLGGELPPVPADRWIVRRGRLTG